ncbi:MAG TPA: RdgB/HAM1 family non-canonical purine NTP pyrophosphatase [Acidimicrobiia bacterium]|nr:RdgB/HAM1 family non-canonical purine NTP pyrophosphatase [Acidimicrobiia bacterium]
MSGRTAIPRLVVASKNPDKIIEIESVLVREGLVAEIARGLSWPDVEETEPTLEGNALLKARAVAAATGLPALADDTGLEVAALGGEPGVHTARFAGPGASYHDNVEKMLAVLDGVVDRRATFRSVVAVVWPGGAEVTAEGRLDGAIAKQARGRFGFGYDPVFEVAGKTLAEMGREAKDTVSHRSLALRALAELLRKTRLGDNPLV